MTGINGVALIVFIVLFALVTVMGFLAARWRRPTRHGAPRRVGPGRPRVRHLDHLVPARRRPLHRLHVRRRAGGDVGAGSVVRVLRRAVHDRALPDHLPLPGAGCGRSRTGTATSPRPTSCAAASARGAVASRSRSPASSRRCPTSRCSWSASRRCSRSSASAAASSVIWPRTCRCSSRSPCWRPTPTPRGLRAPALIAFVKDTLIYLVIIVAVIYLPAQARRLGRASSTPRKPKMATRPTRPTGKPTGVLHPQRAAATGPTPPLALGSALALFMYPHSITATCRARRPQHVIRRNAASCRRTPSLLGLLALLGYVAIAAGTKPIGLDGKPNAQLVDSRSCSRTTFPALVRRRRLRGHRHRRAGAGGDHVDRRGEPVHPQHLQGVPQARRDPRRRRPRSPSSPRWW